MNPPDSWQTPPQREVPQMDPYREAAFLNDMLELEELSQKYPDISKLIGGLEHELYFSIYWKESSQLTFIFFRRGRSTTNQNNGFTHTACDAGRAKNKIIGFRQLIELCLSWPLDSHLLIISARGLEFQAGFGSLFRSLAQDQSIVETGPYVTLVS